MLSRSDHVDKLEVKTFFFAIGDYSRFSILARLVEKDLNVGEITDATGLEQSNVSHHLSCLLNCGFVSVKKEGKSRIYSINPGVKPIIDNVIRHIEEYRDDIISCDIADREYISKVIK